MEVRVAVYSKHGLQVMTNGILEVKDGKRILKTTHLIGKDGNVIVTDKNGKKSFLRVVFMQQDLTHGEMSCEHRVLRYNPNLTN